MHNEDPGLKFVIAMLSKNIEVYISSLIDSPQSLVITSCGMYYIFRAVHCPAMVLFFSNLILQIVQNGDFHQIFLPSPHG